ncbi:MAG TPA: hypothetical protein VNA14_02280, partial [Mycobacteriales bacterium]|nr:hypothetical protein [Mycobacteriales bacterium]
MHLVVALVVIVASTVGWQVHDVAPAAAANITVNVCNGTDNTGGKGIECEVTVTNNINLATGVTSSTVTVRECHGAANTALPCTTTTGQPTGDLVTAVEICNNVGSGGGGSVTCTVRVTNNITGEATTAPVTVDQCNGSGTGGGDPAVSCNPVGSTVNATVTQCNGSGNGGGATLRVTCEVPSSTQSGALPLRVNQCNGSGNGGGAVVRCSTRMTTNVIAAAATPSPTPSGGVTPSTTPSPTAAAPPLPTLAPSTMPADTPPADSPPADSPPADSPPADSPPADSPPADSPPADSPPAESPPAASG